MWPHTAHPLAPEERPIIYLNRVHVGKSVDSKPKNASHCFVMFKIMWLLCLCKCQHRLWLKHRCYKRSAAVYRATRSDGRQTYSRLRKTKSKGLIRRCKARHFHVVLQLLSSPFLCPLVLFSQAICLAMFSVFGDLGHLSLQFCQSRLIIFLNLEFGCTDAKPVLRRKPAVLLANSVRCVILGWTCDLLCSHKPHCSCYSKCNEGNVSLVRMVYHSNNWTCDFVFS